MKLVDVSRSESENDVVRKEAEAQQLLSAVNEKRIVSLKAFFRNDQNQFVLVTEETVGTLQQLIEANHSFTEHEVKVIAFGALEALLTVHNNYHIHRNIHPSSFFFTSNDLNSLKLGNFACVTDENGFNSASGLKGIEGFRDSGTVQYEHPGGRQYVIDQIQKTQEAGATGWEKLARSVTTSKNGRVPDNDDEDGEVRIAPAKLKEAAMNLVRGLTKKR
ncbi:hypothetical protein HDU99_005099 [Rhizoclosmatium hyalinum]|nr:hypothetical protein HDU99_005099 [Rhizoclosmatium hyalinum]